MKWFFYGISFFAGCSSGKLHLASPRSALEIRAPAFELTEGESVPVTVTLAQSLRSSALVQWSIDGDFAATSGTLSFAAGETAKTFMLNANDNASVEGSRSHTVQVNGSNAHFTNAPRAAFTLKDNEPPLIRVAPGAVTEGAAGATNMIFTVTASHAPVTNIDVNYVTTDGTALSASDYAAAIGTATILAGSLTTTVSVPVQGDSLYEANETFTLTLSGGSGYTVAGSVLTATGRIDNDDPAPSLTVAAATAVEGSPLVFTITQSVTSGIPTSVQWTLSAGTATPGADYSVASGTAVIGAGQTATTVFVTTLFDTVDESDETLTFTLSQPQNADLGAPVSAVGMIEDTALYLDFMTGTLPPEVSFTRASTGTYVNPFGVTASAAVDTPRFEHGASALEGLVVETAATNAIRNNVIAGGTDGVIGSGGSNPTNWGAIAVAGVTIERVGTGTEDGLNYIDLRYSGTNAMGSAQFSGVYFDSNTGIVAASGQAWNVSFYAKVVAGTLSSGLEPRAALVERTAAGASLAFNEEALFMASTRERFGYTATLSSGSTARVQPGFRLRIASGTTLDVTFRIYSPQAAQSAFTTSLIPTSGAPANRAADQVHVAIADGTYNIRIGTKYVNYDILNVVVAGGAGWDFAWPVAAVTASQRFAKTVIFTTGALPPDPFLLEWSPPAQTAPRVEIVGAATYYGPYGDNEDVLLIMPSTIKTTQLQVDGGRHVRVIGGHLRPAAVPSGNFVMRIANITGSAFVEGMILDAALVSADGFNVWGKNGFAPDVYLQNMRIENVNGSYAGVHADIFQHQDDIGQLKVHRLTGTSNYQGFFIPPQHSIASTTFKEVNLSFQTNPLHTGTYLLWFRDNCAQAPYAVSLWEVYISPRAGQDIAQHGVWPSSAQTGCAATKTGSYVSWPPEALVSGVVTEGAPLTGDFVPAGANVGADYISPGYR